jgi:hypothetical protein
MSAKHLSVLIVVLLLPGAATAQQTSGGSGESGGFRQSGGFSAVAIDLDQTQPAGPMKIERVQSGAVIAPDFKVTRFDGRTSALLGGYGGWLSERTLFIGGGGYWLVNGGHDRGLGYGGLVLQWLGRGDQAIGYSLKGLVGGGEATLAQTITQTVRFPDLRGIDGRLQVPQRTPQTITTRVRTEQAFFIAEPEADVVIRLTRSLHLTAGAGYRIIAAEHGNESRLRGPVGTIGLQLGGGY